jgi:acyl-CoA reductase-like NAD-dependent aldehyde dehydrogenase
MRGIDAIEDGYFVRPTLVFGAAQDSELVSVEQFAPVLPVLSVDSDAQAVEWANQSRYGLSGSVWSESQEHALEVAARLDSGSVLVNSTRVVANPWRLPFGGAKQSGVGRLGPLAGLLSYSEPQHNVAMHG